MNILVIGKFYTEGFALHIAETLSTMGHTVRRFEPGCKSAGSRVLEHKGVEKTWFLSPSAHDKLASISGSTQRTVYMDEQLWEATLVLSLLSPDASC